MNEYPINQNVPIESGTYLRTKIYEFSQTDCSLQQTTTLVLTTPIRSFDMSSTNFYAVSSMNGTNTTLYNYQYPSFNALTNTTLSITQSRGPGTTNYYYVFQMNLMLNGNNLYLAVRDASSTISLITASTLTLQTTYTTSQGELVPSTMKISHLAEKIIIGCIQTGPPPLGKLVYYNITSLEETSENFQLQTTSNIDLTIIYENDMTNLWVISYSVNIPFSTPSMSLYVLNSLQLAPVRNFLLPITGGFERSFIIDDKMVFFNPGAFGFIAVENCPKGSFLRTQPSIQCVTCTSSNNGPTYMPEKSKMQACYDCQTPNVSPTTDTCLACPTGYQPLFPQRINCTICSTNTYSAFGQCQQCPVGTFSNAGSGSCTNCTAGTYGLGDGRGCTQCDINRYSTEIGAKSQSVCTLCPTGYFAPIKGASSLSDCKSCPLGSYQTTTQTTYSCTKCPAGTYQPNLGGAGLGACVFCPSGTYSTNDGLSVCDSCPKGAYCPPGSDRIGSAALGSYNASTSRILDPRTTLKSSYYQYLGIKLGVMFGITSVVFFIILIIYLIYFLCKRDVKLFDVFYAEAHYVQILEPRIKKPTNMGSLYGFLALIIIIFLLTGSFLDFLITNAFEKESLILADNRYQSDNTISIAMSIPNSKTNCNRNSITISTSGFTGKNAKIRTNITQNTNTILKETNTSSCDLTFACKDCQLGGFQQNVCFTISGSNSYTSHIFYNINMTSVITNYKGERENHTLSGYLAPETNTLFYGKTTTLYISTFNSNFTTLPSFGGAILHIADYFSNDPIDPTTQGLIGVLSGYTLGVVDNNSSLTMDSSNPPLPICFTFSTSSTTFVIEQVLKQTTLNFLSQIASLASSIILLFSILFSNSERFLKWFRGYIQTKTGGKPEEIEMEIMIRKQIEEMNQKITSFENEKTGNFEKMKEQEATIKELKEKDEENRKKFEELSEKVNKILLLKDSPQEVPVKVDQ